jgi:hypothetical protein
MNQNNSEKELKRLIEESRTLFGDVEELSKNELADTLSETGQPPDQVRRSMWLSAEAVCKQMRLRGQIPPRRYTELLNQLRPETHPSRHVDVLVQQARRWITDLLSGVRTHPELNLQFAFRNKEDISAADAQILDEAEADVRKKIGLIHE